ncbi:conserved hypothetical protein, partial [Ricinus communis]
MAKADKNVTRTIETGLEKSQKSSTLTNSRWNALLQCSAIVRCGISLLIDSGHLYATASQSTQRIHFNEVIHVPILAIRYARSPFAPGCT